MQLSEFPRRRYVDGPTTIEALPALTKLLGGPRIFVKRDDKLGGNKTRKLEFLVAEALAQGADTLVTVGAVQSNHCMLTLLSAIREGLKCRLVLEERVPGSYNPNASGNNFLYRLMGAEELRVVRHGGDPAAAMSDVMDELAAEGRKGYLIPGGGSSPLGSLGYVMCADEILRQSTDLGLPFSAVVCGSGSGGTHAGLAAGAVLRHGIPAIGVSVRFDTETQVGRIRKLTGEILELLGHGDLTPDIQVVDEYVGPGYSIPTEETLETIRLLARTEGLLVDPVYTGKAMAGLIGMVREGRWGPDENVLFLHTGGSTALYSYQDAVLGATS